MPDTIRTVLPGKTKQTVTTRDGATLTVPTGWALLPPGDAALTRRIKKTGVHWQVQVKRGRRTFSQGVWAPEARIRQAMEYVKTQRADPIHQRRLQQGRVRREKKQEAYAMDFYDTVLGELNFHPRFSALAQRLARAVTDHAIPVGSNTVARTERIPVEDRARAAVIAWMRHHTTGYDTMTIPRIKGQRRKVRRQLAQGSQGLLNRYRSDTPVDKNTCPLQLALERLHPTSNPE